MQQVSFVRSPSVQGPGPTAILPPIEKSMEADFASLLGGLFAAFQGTQAPATVSESVKPDLAPVSRDSAASQDLERPLADPTDNEEAPAGLQRPEGQAPTDGPTDEAPAPDPGTRAPGKDTALATSQPGRPLQTVTPTVEPDAVPLTLPVGPETPTLQEPVSQGVVKFVSGGTAEMAEAGAPPQGSAVTSQPGTAVPFVPLRIPELPPSAELPRVPAAAVDSPAPAAAPPAVVPVVPVVPPSVLPVKPVEAGPSEVLPVGSSVSGTSSASVPRLARTAAPLGVSMVERIAGVVKLQASQGGGRVKMLLHPPHLGALKVEVTVRDGMVMARMEAETAAARHALSSNLADLRQSLEANGMTLGQLSVSVGDGRQPGAESQPPAFSSGEGDGVEALEAAADVRPEARVLRLLDVTV